MSITSAGERLALQLDSCCSVSLVSKVHADFVASKRPDIKHCALEELISVLVVPGLVKPILFGENHLHATKALVIDHLFVPLPFEIEACRFVSSAFSAIHLKASILS